MRILSQVLSRQQILFAVWDYDFDPESNVVEVYVRYLRSKIDEPGEPSLITTVRRWSGANKRPKAFRSNMYTTLNWQKMIIIIALALLVLALAGPTAFADELDCFGALGPVTVDNLRVPQNATCTLDGTRVEGTIKVETNATLYATNVAVDGNIQAENAARVEVLPESAVGGSIQIVQSGAARVDSVAINGDLLFDENDLYLIANNNIIGGNLQAFQNSGGLLITNNTIDGNLQCKENTPAPIGGGNVVQGNKEDQCANLTQQLMHLPLILGSP